MPFLEVVTRHMASRPSWFKLCKESLSFTSNDWTHTVLVDDEGRGVPWANALLTAYAPELVGDYIWILDDDDICVNSKLIDTLKRLTDWYDRLDLIFGKTDHKDYGILPTDEMWLLPPRFGQVTMCGFVTKRETLQRHATAFSQIRGADYHFVRSVLREVGKNRVYWLNELFARTQHGAHYGASE